MKKSIYIIILYFSHMTFAETKKGYIHKELNGTYLTDQELDQMRKSETEIGGKFTVCDEKNICNQELKFECINFNKGDNSCAYIEMVVRNFDKTDRIKFYKFFRDSLYVYYPNGDVELEKTSDIYPKLNLLEHRISKKIEREKDYWIKTRNTMRLTLLGWIAFGWLELPVSVATDTYNQVLQYFKFEDKLNPIRFMLDPNKIGSSKKLNLDEFLAVLDITRKSLIE